MLGEQFVIFFLRINTRTRYVWFLPWGKVSVTSLRLYLLNIALPLFGDFNECCFTVAPYVFG